MMRREIPLSSAWRFAPRPLDRERLDSGSAGLRCEAPEWRDIDIPHSFEALPLNHFDEACYQKKGTYYKEFETPGLAGDSLAFLEFDGVAVSCSVWLNEEFVGNHRGAYTPFKFDITKYLNGVVEGTDGASPNRLFVEVNGAEDPAVPPFGGVVDYLVYAGIYRAVKITVVARRHLEWIYARPIVPRGDIGAEALARGQISGCGLEVDVKTSAADHPDLDGPGVKGLRLRAILRSGSGIIARADSPLTGPGSMAADNGTTTIRFAPLPPVELWDTDRPALYNLEVVLESADGTGGPVDALRARIGFRDARFTPKGFFLNGRRLFLLGLNRHQSWPYVGGAMGPGPQRKDAEILKHDLGIKIVRTSHYPQSPHFLDACDELGLLVFTEMPGWQHIGGAAWKKQALRDLEDLVLRDRNHPAIVLWGVRINESSDDDAFYAQTNALARRLDPGRQTGGVRALKGSHLLEDVYTYNDFTHSGGSAAIANPRTVTGLRAAVPYLITEHNGHMFPTKRWDQEERLAGQARRHARVADAAMGERQISGAIGWCATDYNTHKDFGSGDRVCYHGVCDMFRIPKYAAHFYASQKPPSDGIVLEAASLFAKGERDAAAMLPIDVWTNCDAVELRHGENFVGRFEPAADAYPRLPHPPVRIDDLIGAQLDGEFSGPGDACVFRRLASKVMIGGVAALSPTDKVKVGLLMARNRLSFGALERLIQKYGYAWGNRGDNFTLVGILDGKEVASRTYGADARAVGLKATPDAAVIKMKPGDEWNAVRILVALVDQYDNPCRFAFEPVKIGIEGPARLLGPEFVSLVGGAAAFWVASINRPGLVKVLVTSSQYGEIGVQLSVEEEE